MHTARGNKKVKKAAYTWIEHCDWIPAVLAGIDDVARVRDAFHLDIPLGRLYASPTVAGLARAIAEIKAEQHSEEHAEILNILAQLSEDEVKSLEEPYQLQPDLGHS